MFPEEPPVWSGEWRRFKVLWVRAANIVLTNLCNGRCPYCDFKDWIVSDADSSFHMSLSDLNKVIDWVRESKLEFIQLLGGEPMLHPDIGEVVKRLVEGGVNVRCILTNGLGDTRLYKQILEFTNMVWLVNVNEPDAYTVEEWELLNRNMKLLSWKGEGRLIRQGGFDMKSLSLQLSIVFYKPEMEYRHVIDLAEKYNCTNISYSYSHPCGDKSNQYMDFKDQVKAKSTLLSFVRDCANKGIKPMTFYPLCPCVFTTEEMRYLMLFSNLRSDSGFVCTPHLEVTPDLDVTYCLPMHRFLRSYKVGSMKALDMARELLLETQKYRDYVLPRCRGCELSKLKKCQGGCLRLKVDHPEGQRNTNEAFMSMSVSRLKKILKRDV